jgi:hypothetical protein
VKVEMRDMPYIAAGVTQVAVNMTTRKMGVMQQRQAKYLCSDIGQFAFHISVECGLDTMSETLAPRMNNKESLL